MTVSHIYREAFIYSTFRAYACIKCISCTKSCGSMRSYVKSEKITPDVIRDIIYFLLWNTSLIPGGNFEDTCHSRCYYLGDQCPVQGHLWPGQAVDQTTDLLYQVSHSRSFKFRFKYDRWCMTSGNNGPWECKSENIKRRTYELLDLFFSCW